MLEVHHITKQFERGFFKKQRVQAVSDVSFQIEKGRAFGIAGNSGCGKSTIARLILRLIEPDSGSIVLDGREITKLSPGKLKPYRQKMQIVFQHPESALDPQKKLLSSLLEPMEIYHLCENREQRIQKIEDLFSYVGLQNDLFSRYPHQISGGEAQRALIVRALTLSPKLLILDEPTSMLDVSIQAHILNILKDLQKELSLTFLFISHDLEVLCWFCPAIGIMKEGQMVEMGEKDAILYDPKHPFTQELVKSFFIF